MVQFPFRSTLVFDQTLAVCFAPYQPRVTAVKSADLLLGFSGVLPIKPSVPALTLPGGRCCSISRLLRCLFTTLWYWRVCCYFCWICNVIQFCSGFFCGFTDKTFSLTSTSHYFVALNLFCRLSGRWTLFMNFVILLISLIVASYNDAFTAEKLETTTSHGAQTVVATSNRTIHLGCQGSSQSAGKLEEPSFERSWILVSNSTTDRSNVGATLEVCTMQKDGKGQRSLLSKLWPALDGMCGWPCISSPCSARGLGLGCHTTTHRNSAAENEKQICRASSRWWLEEEKAKEPADNSVAATRTAKHRGKAKEITKVQESRWMDQLDWVLHRPLQFTRPRHSSHRGCRREHQPVWKQQLPRRAPPMPTASCWLLLPKHFRTKSQMPEELRDLVEKANLQSSKSITKDLHSATSSLGKSKKLLQEVVEAKKAHKQAWTRHLTESLELWQKQLQDFTQQQAMLAEKENKAIRDIQLANKSITESQPAGRRHGRTNERIVNIGTSSPGQSRSLHAEGQRDDRSAKETPKVFWRMHGCYWPQGSKGPCRGDCGFRRRRGQETEKTEVFGSQRWCFVIHGRALLCQKSNRKHAGRVQFDPLVEAYGDSGKHHAAGFGFEVAITFNVDDYRFPLMFSTKTPFWGDQISNYAFGLRANLTANCLRRQVLDELHEDELHRQNRVPERPEVPRHDHTTDPFLEEVQPPILEEPRVIIDEWGFLRDLLTQAAEVPTDAFLLEMYGILITHHSIRVQESGTSIEDIRRTVRATWDDFMPMGSVALVHCLKPQDSVRLSPLQVIVEIIPIRGRLYRRTNCLYSTKFDDTVQDSNPGRRTSEICKQAMRPWLTLVSEMIVNPIHGSKCQVRIEGRVAPLPQRHAVRPGSVVDISIYDDAPQESEFEGTEHTSLMQKTLQPRNVEWRHDNDPQCLGEEDTVAQQWLYPAGLCHDDGSCSSAQLRTTDELQEAIGLRSASRDEETDVPHTAGAPVDPLLIIEDWEDLRVMLRERPDEAPDEAAIVMYGLYQAHVGERRSTAHWDIHAVRECVFRTWDDILLPGVTAFLHLVRPQEYLHQCEIHVIVEFSSPMIPLPSFDMPSLRRTIWHSGSEQTIRLWLLHITLQEAIDLSCCVVQGCQNGADLTVGWPAIYTSKRHFCCP